MGRPGRPERFLFFQRGDDCGIIEDVSGFIERAQSRLMGKQLRESDFVFSCLRKFRPEFRDATIKSDPAFLQRVKQTRAPQTFRGRPEKDDGVGGPWLFAFGIPKSAVQF